VFLVSTSISIASGVVSDRSTPEDAVRVLQTDDRTAFVVADGAGGLGGGARAAHLVVEGFEDVMKNVSPAEATAEMLCSFLRELDGRVQYDPDAGESTAVVAAILDGRVVGASVGDSELWMIAGDGSYEVLTSGQHKSRLGSGRAAPVGFQTMVGNSVIIAATDGLFHAAPAHSICSVLRDAPTPEKLVALARSRSGKLYDDVGIVLVSVS
jgi:serine/threonine protein phosphatase PrpC